MSTPSHPLRVRELKHRFCFNLVCTGSSHPLRVRELKLFNEKINEIEKCRTLYGCVNWNSRLLRIWARSKSHPLRVRELKHSEIESPSLKDVAPFTGAWIETRGLGFMMNTALVAPFTGAWIETSRRRAIFLFRLSHPLRVRELKHLNSLTTNAKKCVAPFTGAWIETIFGFFERSWRSSHPLRVRELKPCTSTVDNERKRRTLYGCVNWNRIHLSLSLMLRVAPFTGAWIETVILYSFIPPFAGRTLYGCVNWNFCFKSFGIFDVLVAPFTGAWIETVRITTLAVCWKSHPLRVRELKREKLGCLLSIQVAPFTGAWIETRRQSFCYLYPGDVAPFTGAWIETE